MEDFPLLENEQVALIRAEIITGKVLNEDFTRNIESQPVPFTVFQKIDDAIQYATEVGTKRKDVEFTIYDPTQKVIKNIVSSTI